MWRASGSAALGLVGLRGRHCRMCGLTWSLLGSTWRANGSATTGLVGLRGRGYRMCGVDVKLVRVYVEG